MLDDYLAHYGILGMKRGVRRYQYRDGSLTPEGILRYRKNNPRADRKANSKADGKTSHKAYKKPNPRANKKNSGKEDLSSISDDELRRRINRINLEKQYRDLTKTEQKAKSRGMRLVEDMIYDATKTVGTQVITYSMGKAVNKVFNGEVVNTKVASKKKKDKDDR